MIHWLQTPKSTQIAKYVECYWLIEKTADSSAYQHPKLNPDPSAHLIISPEDQAYHYDLNPGIASGVGSHWLFPHKQTFELDHSNAFIHLGIKFKIGALYSLPNFSNDPLALDRVELVQDTLLFKQLGLNDSQLIDTARSNPDQCCAQLDTLLTPWLAACSEDQHSILTNKAL